MTLKTLVRRVKSDPHADRRGAILVLAAIFLIVVFAFAAFSIDTGYMLIVKSELQAAADGAALAGVLDLPNGQTSVDASVAAIASSNKAAGKSISIPSKEIEMGLFDLQSRKFTPTTENPNAVRITARVTDQAHFLAPVIQHKSFNMSASAIAMLNPRDIVFVIDLSGSMNDDTEPVWATNLIRSRLDGQGFGSVATEMIQAVYDDFGYGTYPGDIQYLGEPLGVSASEYAYAEMTKDDGPLTCNTLADQYRILNSDSETVRREKCYRWIIDYQIAELMPNAKPTPDSSVNYDYWQRYIDYIMEPCWVGTAPDPGSGGDGDGGGDGGGGGYTPPTPPSGRLLSSAIAPKPGKPKKSGISIIPVSATVGCGAVTFTKGQPRRGASEYIQVPPDIRIDNMYHYNNPNFSTFPEAGWDSIWNNTNRISYKTYVQFMMDYGREKTSDLADSGVNCTPLSTKHPDCPWHDEDTAGGTFSFPPREQPTHAARRALIAAIEFVRKQNTGVPAAVGDWVSIVTYDAVDSTHAPTVAQGLTSDFSAAMQACTRLQACWDNGTTTATENGIKEARDLLKPVADGGTGRKYATKVIVLLTDGVPNVWSSSGSDVETEQGLNPTMNDNYYDSDYLWYNAAIMQASKFQRVDKGKLYAVGMGMGADLGFTDRMARMAKTDKGGVSPRGAGSPADYEQRLTDIFKEIILSPGSRLVK